MFFGQKSFDISFLYTAMVERYNAPPLLCHSYPFCCSCCSLRMTNLA